jgi:FKBP-type peptidyl-prolyl cis-trans isomerase
MKILVAAMMFLLVVPFTAEAKKKAKETKVERAETLKSASGLVIEDLKVGDGKAAKLGSKITVHYRGTFKDGKEFDSSYGAGRPITFELAEGRLIKGWTDGIPGMKVGGKRKLEVPYKLAYGERGTPDGTIPPKTDLFFEVELIKVE